MRPINNSIAKASRVSFLLTASLFFGICIYAIQGERQPGSNLETKVDIGKKLFFDPILSLDSSISCASCHNPKFAFADSAALSRGVNDSLGTRNTPSVMNMAFRPYFFYDGRAATLEDQAMGPIENPVEMHLDYGVAVERVANHPEYRQLFLQSYGSLPDSALVIAALASFQRSLESTGNAPHDRWLNGEDPNALSPSQLRGREIFLEKGKCFDCHFGPDFTGDEFRNIGLYDADERTDKGRFDVTEDSTDLGKFKVPGLRNIALTAPYMHDGSIATLEEVIDYYDNPYQFVDNPVNIDSLLRKPLGLSDQEKADLVAFMHSLTDPIIPFRD
ncbi:MAG TPA: c-type cytochrome [Bacteroidetes bacterium]|nr:c-type cytochrome [Bacteroidota bacterium]